MTAPTTRSTSFQEALEHIAAEHEVWFRLAAVPTAAGAWEAHLLELVSGAAPPNWIERTWAYPAALFVGGLSDGASVVAWLRSRIMHVADEDVALPEFSQQPSWERRHGRSPAVYESLEWPATEASLAHHTAFAPEPYGHLVSGDAPSFVTFYAAAACFFWLDRKAASAPLQQGVVYRHQDRRGRIAAVRIGRDCIDVDVDGEALDEMVVELAGDVPGPSQRVPAPAPHVVRFPLEDGLPTGTWVLLRLGSEWIDRRFLSVAWTRGLEPGVEIVVEPLTRLEALVASRERHHVEFKRELPADVESKWSVMRTICAFANGGGGSVLVGVDDDRILVGLRERDVDRVRDQITQMIGTWVEPRPDTNFDVLPIAASGKVVLEVTVGPGRDVYACGRPGEVRTVYVRHHGITERATVAEITALVQQRRRDHNNLVPFTSDW